MENPIVLIVVGVLGLLGTLAGFIFGKKSVSSDVAKLEEESKKEALRIVENAKKEAENIKKNQLIEAKEEKLKLTAEFEKSTRDRESKLIQKEADFKNRQSQLSQKIEQQSRKDKELENERALLVKQKETLENKQQEVERQHITFQQELEKISGMSKEDAKQQLIESVRARAESEAMKQSKVIIEETMNKANKEAKKIIIQSIQRTASEYAIENTVSVFNLDSDDLKGQIIGREGRNIRAIEAATGCELVVDDTPEAIIISGYDPIRREVARLSLQRLVADGRIHPARIEEVVLKTQKQLEDHIVEIGERTVLDLNIQGMHPELIRYIGRMRFRSSYGQNLLMHSREVANLCATMAAELGLNPKLATRAGLLHDIGKVPDEESESSEAVAGSSSRSSPIRSNASSTSSFAK